MRKIPDLIPPKQPRIEELLEPVTVGNGFYETHHWQVVCKELLERIKTLEYSHNSNSDHDWYIENRRRNRG